jgi:hypothetical protein
MVPLNREFQAPVVPEPATILLVGWRIGDAGASSQTPAPPYIGFTRVENDHSVNVGMEACSLAKKTGAKKRRTTKRELIETGRTKMSGKCTARWAGQGNGRCQPVAACRPSET